MFPTLRPLLSAAIRHELAGRFSPDELARIARTALDECEDQRRKIPDEVGGARVMVELAALSIGVYRALLARVGEADARRLTARVTWRLFRALMAVPSAMARLSSQVGANRLRRATDFVRRYPFHAPGYQVVDVPAPEGVDVAFDVLRCPVASYFQAQGLPEVCCQVWCDLDHRLAAEWGAVLERSGTLAAGADRCDFRWSVAGPEPGAGRTS